MGVRAAVSSRPRAVFLDRDGVLNCAVVRDGKPYPPQSAAELRIVPGAPAALASLRERGFLLVVVTNQPDVARGRQTMAAIDAIHRELRSAMPLDDVLVCCHDDSDRCSCRKPLPGLLLEAQSRYDIDMARSFLIGDRWRDVDAGRAAGCRTVWIDYGYRERGPSAAPNAVVDSIANAAEWILRADDTQEDIP
jgi:D-glycero-D-manno-heptose 1,7-bisphosphate phosphatase